MDITQMFAEAVDLLWTDLPNLVGKPWYDLEFKFTDYRHQLLEGSSNAVLAQAYIIHELSAYPRAFQRLTEAISQIAAKSSEEQGVTLRYSGTPSETLNVQVENPKKSKRYADIICPSRVWIDEPQVVAVISITTSQPDKNSLGRELTLYDDKPLQIKINTGSFEVLSKSDYEMVDWSKKDKLDLLIYMKPLIETSASINFQFFDENQVVDSVEIPIQIMSSRRSPPDIILMVEWNATLSYLKYILIRNGGAWRRQFTMTLEQSDPATFAANFYRRIADLVEHKDPASAVIRNRRLEISPNDVDQRIMQMGHYLWESLLPAEFRKLYADNREQWRDKTLLISSDDPYLPWELIWPYDEENGEWDDNGPWCITTRLTRWLYRDEKSNGNEEPPDVLKLGKAALIAPIYKHLDNLPLAKIEQDTLRGLFEQYRIANVAPTQATWQTVIDLLKFGDCDWVHVAAHGSFYSSEPEGNSAIWLDEDVALTPEHLGGSEMTRYFKERRPAFVINACEIGRQGWGVTRIGGWANRLVRLKARLFIAPLWAVSDFGATSFSTAFYRLLLQGETVGTAVRQARLESRRKGDPTWLAYSVYAHPNAVLEIINE